MQEKHKQPITIGVLPGWQAYTGSLDTFLDHVFRGIRTAASEFECNLVFGCGSGPGYGQSLGTPAWPIIADGVDFIPIGPWNCDGLIIIPPFASDTGRIYFQGLVDSGFPVVFAGSHQKGPGVNVDNEGGIRQALNHLLYHKHTEIAFISGRVQSNDSDSLARLHAYLRVLEENGLPIDPDLVVTGNHTYEGGREAMAYLLARAKKFTAVLASNDQSAVGAMDVLRDSGIFIPDDVAIIGFDDRFEAKSQLPLLTTVRFPMFEMGYQAFHYLMKRISDPEVNIPIQSIPVHLVIRNSCGCRIQSFSPYKSSLLKKKVKYEKSLKQKLYKEIADEVYKETQRFNYEEITYLSNRLLDTFILSIVEDNVSTFLTTLEQILAYAHKQGEDLFAWQRMITEMRERKIEFLTLTRQKDAESILDFLDTARAQISEETRGYSSQESIQRSISSSRVGQMTSQLFTARDEEDIFSALSENLPSIGVTSALVGIYEPHDTDPLTYCNLYFANLEGQKELGSSRCPSREFSPFTFLPQNCHCSQILPLKLDEKRTGFVCLGTTHLEFGSLIAQQISSALKSIRLYREISQINQLAEERRQAAEEATRLKSRFLSMVSHELRAPLSLISGLADVILKENANNSENALISRLDLERMKINAQHLDGLIRDVLDLAKMEIGKFRLSCEPISLENLLQDCSAIGKLLAQDKGLHWTYTPLAMSPKIWGDKTRLQQVILNLINNAIKFSENGTIIMTVDVRHGSSVVSLQDSGIGVPEEEQKIIFEEFHQSERTSSRGYGGLGLGLAICKKIIDMHGGEIGVCSDGKGSVGSTFYFTLPILLEKKEEILNIIDLEDAKSVVLLNSGNVAESPVHRLIRSKNYRVEIISINGSDWLNQIVSLKPDLILVEGDPFFVDPNLLRILKNNPITENVPMFLVTLAPHQKIGENRHFDLSVNSTDQEDHSPNLPDKYLGTDQGKRKDYSTILVVDDDPDVVDLHTRILKNYDSTLQIVSASNGLQALMKLRQQPVDLVVLDLHMPELNGFSLQESMQFDEKLKNIPIVIVTNQSITEGDLTRLSSSVIKILDKRIFDPHEISEQIVLSIEKHPTFKDPQKRILKAIGYIHAHYAEPLARTQLARFVGLSERHLDRCFQKELGITPMVYINRYRVKQARELLESSGKGITEIALEVGFSSSGYFSRVFREEVGITPSKYASDAAERKAW